MIWWDWQPSTFLKRKIICWLKNAEEVSYSGSRSSTSKKKKKSETSKETKSSSGSKSFKEKELDDKIRFAKLAAEAELLEHKQMVETQKQMWSTQAKNKGRIIKGKS